MIQEHTEKSSKTLLKYSFDLETNSSWFKTIFVIGDKVDICPYLTAKIALTNDFNLVVAFSLLQNNVDHFLPKL